MVRPTKPYFLVKISKQEQRKRKEKIGSFYTAPSEVKMTRNKQSGEIVAIGQKAGEIFPEAKVGHTLIIHHFVEGDEETLRDVLVFEDEIYNYYVVSAYEQYGHATESYGVWDGEKIIPHPEFIFLEKESAPINDIDSEAYLNQAMESTSGGLLVFKQYTVNREDNTQKLEKLKADAAHLGKTELNPEIKVAIEEIENEMSGITKEMNKTTFKPYNIAYAHPILNQWFDKSIVSGDVIFCQSNASTEVEFGDKTYLLCNTKHIGFMLS